jgi:predicted nucleic acid-binding Zn ribbon protein
MERLGGEVKRELSRFGTAGAMTELVAAWPAAVGETVAANAWPARLARDGTLHVNAASSTWAFELQQLEAEIADHQREAVPGAAPSRLRFAAGPLPELSGPPPEEARRPPPEPTLEHVREARELAAAIDSGELRKSVEKAARMSLVTAADGRSAC